MVRRYDPQHRKLAQRKETAGSTIVVRCLDFGDGEAIPAEHSRDGGNQSPAITWSDLPENTHSLALICDDPDAPTEDPFVHWVIYNIRPDLTTPGMAAQGLPAGISSEPRPSQAAGAVQGVNSWGLIGYGGPQPPQGHGVHRYHFRIYALDRPLPDRDGMTKEKLLDAMQGHVLGSGETVGTFSR